MYERTIAGEHRIYQIEITSTPTSVYDLLGVSDKSNYDALLTIGTVIQPLNYASLNNAKIVARTPIDGYVVCPTSEIKVRTTDGSADETVPVNERYTSPVYFWPHKTLVSSDAGPVTAIVRIFFS
jgi:hypothetical protein